MCRLEFLVVDDLPAIRFAIRLALQTISSHLEVIEAANLQEAKSSYQKHPGIVLVISDYHLPDGTGLQLFDWVRRFRIVPFLLMSASYHAPYPEHYTFLPKPFDIGRLRDVITKVLPKALPSHPVTSGPDPT